jgi:hypothetical protein
MNIPQDRPAYRILEGSFFGPDDHLYKEGECIVFDDEPNEQMEPLNDLAREAMNTYLTKLDKLAQAVAEKNGRSFASRRPTLEESMANAHQEARRVELISGDGGVPLMGAKRGRGRPRIEKLGGEEVPETRGKSGNLRISA